MNCQEFNDWLDLHGVRAFEAAAGADAAIRAHHEHCTDCQAARTAIQSLRADVVPEPMRLRLAAEPDATDRAAPVNRPAPSAASVSPRRRLLPGLSVIGLGLGGIVFASAGWYAMQLTETTDESALVADQNSVDTAIDAGDTLLVGSETSGSDAEAELLAFVESAEDAEIEAHAEDVLGSLPDGEYFSLLRVPPAYPPEAAERALNGDAIVEFTITARGDVEGITIVESSDPVFDAPTIEATRQQKYKPRVENGRGVDVQGVRNKYVYQMEEPGQPTPLSESAQVEAGDEETETPDNGDLVDPAALDHEQFSVVLEPMLRCLEAGDLRCMELQLDQIMATYELSAQQESRLWHFYGFIHHRRGRYQLAIDAYRNATAVRPADGSNYLNTRALMIAAMIHYELEQYQEAMDAASEYLNIAENPMASDYLFVEKLRELGAIRPGEG